MHTVMILFINKDERPGKQEMLYFYKNLLKCVNNIPIEEQKSISSINFNAIILQLNLFSAMWRGSMLNKDNGIHHVEC
jgi:hypothetical protein